jgi:allantoin racemase
VVIDCMGDPGLFGARECVSIPVLGPMQTAMGIAAMMGHKF